jgi:hydrogenase expression/formation protein HypC
VCLAIPGQILELIPESDLALVEVSGVKRRINVGLLSEEGVAPGEWVLIHVGFAMSKVDEKEARATLEFLNSMGQAFIDEVEALETSAIE